jgi:AraC-like DNA-binding protein/ligand-binding sensor protein
VDKYKHFENLSIASGLPAMVIDICGKILFQSSLYTEIGEFLSRLYEKMDCEESCHISFLYGCYQARRFGGRYIFYAPSGLVYCASPLLDEKGNLLSGVLLGPFILTDYEDFLEFDIREKAPEKERAELRKSISVIPLRSPKEAHGISEHLYYVAASYFSQLELVESVSKQNDFYSTAYPLEIENELLTAISKGDIHLANDALGKMLEQIMYYCGGNLEVLRSRIVELIVLLSRAALKGGGDINSILGLNYEYLKEIDTFSSVEDIALWLQTVIRRFTGHVFDFSESKHTDIIYQAVEYIKRNYSEKITLQELAKYLFISQSYFCRIFKDGTGQTLGEYITYIRIEESKKLLANKEINIVDIPEMVGFEGQSYFTRVFKKQTGTTPGKYRRENVRRKR